MPVWVRFDVFDALGLDCDPVTALRDIVAGYTRRLPHMTGAAAARPCIAAYEYLRYSHPERFELAYDDLRRRCARGAIIVGET